MSQRSNDWYDTEEPTLVDVGIREVDYDPFDYAGYTPGHVSRRIPQSRLGCVTLGVLVAFILLGFAATLMVRGWLQDGEPQYEVVPNDTAVSGLSPVFTPQVLFWADDILRWAEEYQVDPNLIATVMQIESCGDPNAGSPSGAQGLFQVMPFHFPPEEQAIMKDADTNAKRGLNYLIEGLRKAEGHVGLALAGYNGGHGVIDWGTARWSNQTQRYYYWGTGIYFEAISGKQSSDRLQEWLDAGGIYLCAQAEASQQALAQS